MARRRKAYPNDVVETPIPAEAMEAAIVETYRFLHNYHIWKGDLAYLCACGYLQGALDGAQVQARLATSAHEEEPHG